MHLPPTLQQLKDLCQRGLARLGLSKGEVSVKSLGEDILTLSKAGKIDSHTTSMLRGVLDINNLRARDLMIPRAHIDWFDADEDLRTVVDRALEMGHSRFPVISEDQESLGLIFSKDLLKVIATNPTLEGLTLQDVIKPVKTIPDSKLCITLLQEFQATHTHLALVVNEFGEIAGLITIEDIIEEIVGEIEDEFDKSDNVIRQVTQNSFDILGICPIWQFNKQFGTELSDEEFDTLGGYITNMLGEVPRRNTLVHLEDGKFALRVISATERQITKMRMRISQDSGLSFEHGEFAPDNSLGNLAEAERKLEQEAEAKACAAAEAAESASGLTEQEAPAQDYSTQPSASADKQMGDQAEGLANQANKASPATTKATNQTTDQATS